MRRIRVYIFFGFAALLMRLAFGAVTYVGPTGTNSVGCGAIGSPCETYAYALNTLAADAIELLPGTYPNQCGSIITTTTVFTLYASSPGTVLLTCAGGTIHGHMNGVSGNVSNIAFSGGTSGIFVISGAAKIAFSGCTFSDATRTVAYSSYTGRGAALWVTSGATLSATNCTFARLTSANNNLGGAIFVAAGAKPVLLVSCVFDSCSAGGTGRGGAINSQTETTIVNSTFSQSSAYAGGAICISVSTKLTVNQTLFQNNYVTAWGADIFNEDGGVIALKNSQFINSYAVGTSSVSGGAIHAQAQLIVEGCEFRNCFNTYYGAGVAGSLRAVIRDSIFDSGYANTAGAAIWFNGPSQPITIENTIFMNHRGNSGGAVGIAASTATVNNCTFQNNAGLVNGNGALYTLSPTVTTITNSNFFNNTGAGSGGAITHPSPGALTISNCHFEQNYAPTAGSIISAGAGVITITNSSFIKNRSSLTAGNGGIFMTAHATNALTMSNCRFEGNEAFAASGVYSTRTTVISDSVFRANFNRGIGAVSHQIGKPISILRSVFDGNRNEIQGGAAFYSQIAASTITIANSSFVNNVGGLSGGAVYIIGGTSAEISSTIFANNSANLGGAMFIGQRATINHCEFTNNTAPEAGGCVALAGTGLLTVIRSNFTHCRSNGNGGGIYVQPFTATLYQLTVQDSAFRNGFAAIGSAIMSAGVITTNRHRFAFNRTVFENNTALSYGAVYLTSDINVNTVSWCDSCVFRQNQAMDAGALLVRSGTVLLWSSQFFSNSALFNGGAVLVTNSTRLVDASNCTFSDNSAQVSGGAIAATETSRLSVTNTIFTHNVAGPTSLASTTCADESCTQGGGALFLSTTTTTSVSGGVFSSNVAQGGRAGGAIMSATTTFPLVSGVTFQSNTAQMGGGLHLGRGGNVSNCIFTSNVAVQFGGGIMSSGLGASTSYSLFADNAFTNNQAAFGAAVFVSNGRYDVTGGSVTSGPSAGIVTCLRGSIMTDTISGFLSSQLSNYGDCNFTTNGVVLSLPVVRVSFVSHVGGLYYPDDILSFDASGDFTTGPTPRCQFTGTSVTTTLTTALPPSVGSTLWNCTIPSTGVTGNVAVSITWDNALFFAQTPITIITNAVPGITQLATIPAYQETVNVLQVVSNQPFPSGATVQCLYTGVSFNFLVSITGTGVCDAPAMRYGSYVVSVLVNGVAEAGLSLTFTTSGSPRDLPILNFVPTEGLVSGQTLVTISSSNFGALSDNITVTMGGTVLPSTNYTFDSVSQIRLLAPRAASAGPVTISIVSSSQGDASLTYTYTAPAVSVLTSFTPNNGPFAGGNLLTITGTSLGGGSDIISVTINSVAAIIISQTTSSVIVRVPATNVAGAVSVSTSTTLFGGATANNAYTYNPAPVITSVVPSFANCVGGALVTITGTNLGSGSDITSVTLASVSAILISQTSTRVVVQAATHPLAVSSGSVTANSTAFGYSVLAHSFSYTPSFLITTNNGLLVEGSPINIGISLDAQPSQSVTTTLSTFNLRAGVTVSSLTFTSADWNTPQFFTMLAKDNYIADGNAGCPLILSSTTSMDALFNGLFSNFSFVCVDNDRAGLSFSNASATLTYWPRNGAFLMLEGHSLPMDVYLTSQPMTPVTVSLTSQDATRLQTNATALLFDDSNWNISQPVLVHAPISGLDSILWLSVVSTSSSSDPMYNNHISHTVSFLVVSLDSAQAVRMPPVFRNCSEDGSESEINLLMTKTITDPLTVTLASGNTNEITLAATSVVIQPSDYLVPFTVPLLPLHDWIDDDDQRVTISATYPTVISGVTVTVTSSVPVWNYDIDTAAILTDSRLLITNETGPIDIFPVKLTSKPVSDVTVVVGYDSTVYRVTPTSLSFSSVNWNTSQMISVSGLKTFGHWDVYSNLTLTTRTIDTKYSPLSVSVSAINKDIYWPYKLNLVPEVWPLGGMNGTLSGIDMLEYATLEVHGLQATRYLYQNHTGNFTVGFYPPANYSITGYANLTVRNPDGGFTTLIEPMFFTNDCPFVGYVGTGTNCLPCPTGGYCPGGNRIWALQGWWSPGEFSGIVQPCQPAERCVGGRFSTCKEGHVGAYCSLCEDRWYMDTDNMCVQCQDSSYIGFLFFVQFSFLGIYLLVMYFGSEDAVQNVEFVLLNLRVVWLVGAQSTEGIPAEVTQVFSVLRLFVGDVSFVNPACSGLRTKADVFALNVGVSLGCIIPLLAAIVFRYYTKAKLTTKYMLETKTGNPEEVAAYAKSVCIKECIRASYSVFDFCFEVILVKAMESLVCVNSDGALRLQSELDQLCFDSTHMPVAIVAIILIVVLALFPIAGLVGAIKHHHHQGEAGMLAHLAGEQMAEPFHERVWWFGPVQILTMDVTLIITDTFIQGYFGSFVQLLVQGSILLYTSVVFIIFRPFIDPAKNVGFLLVMLISVVSTLAQLLMIFGQELSSQYLNYATLALLVLFAVCVFGMAMWSLFARKLWRMLQGYRQRVDDMDDDALYKQSDVAAMTALTRNKYTSQAKYSMSLSTTNDDDGKNSLYPDDSLDLFRAPGVTRVAPDMPSLVSTQSSQPGSEPFSGNASLNFSLPSPMPTSASQESESRPGSPLSSRRRMSKQRLLAEEQDEDRPTDNSSHHPHAVEQ